MACTYCFTGGSKDYRWDDVANVIWEDNTACAWQIVPNECIDNATRDGGCTLCTGCAYTGTNGSGNPSCFSNALCTTPCGVIPDLPGAAVVSQAGLQLDAIVVWTLTAAVFVSTGIYWLRRVIAKKG